MKRILLFLLVFIWLVNSQIFSADTIDNLPMIEIVLSQREKIDFDREKKTSDARLGRVIMAIFDYCLEAGIKTGFIQNSGGKWENDLGQRDLEKLKKDLWNLVKTEFPEWKLGDYNRQNFYHFLAWQFPRIMADYGIYTELNYGEKKENGKLILAEIIICLNDIFLTENRKIGDNLFKVIYLSDGFTVDKKKWLNAPGNYRAGSSYFGSVQIYTLAATNIDQNQKDKKRLWQEANKYGIKVLDRVLSEADSLNRMEAVELAEMKLLLNYGLDLVESVNLIEETIYHECQHMMDLSDPVLAEKWSAVKATESDMLVDSETSAYLGVLIDSPDKENLVYDLLFCYGVAENNNLNLSGQHHAMAQNNLCQEIINVILANPDEYGLVLSDKSPAEHQALYRLPDLIENGKLRQIGLILRDKFRKNGYTFRPKDDWRWTGAGYGVILLGIGGLVFYRSKGKKEKPSGNKKRPGRKKK